MSQTVQQSPQAADVAFFSAPLAEVDPEVFERFSSALRAGMQSPDVRNAMLTQGTTPAWVPAEQASAEIQHLKEHWGEVAQRIDLKAE